MRIKWSLCIRYLINVFIKKIQFYISSLEIKNYDLWSSFPSNKSTYKKLSPIL